MPIDAKFKGRYRRPKSSKWCLFHLIPAKALWKIENPIPTFPSEGLNISGNFPSIN